MSSPIPVLRPSVSGAEIAGVMAVLRSGWWGMGPVCERFETELAAMTGYKYCVTVNSATAALHLALLACGVGPGNEVIVPALTFVSTALAVLYCGARPVFADVQHETLTLDPVDVAAKRTWRTSAVIPVDYAGYPAVRPTAARLCQSAWPVTVIEDAAHACGGRPIGDLVCYSFHPVKNLATGDGGAILTNNREQAEQLRRLRWCGIDRSTWQRVENSKSRYAWDYTIQEVGYKYHWNDIQAAIGLAQLHRLPELNRQRRLIAKRYLTELADVPGVELPADHPDHTWHLFALRVPATQRDGLIDHLASQGIAAGVHYKPLTYYTALFGPRATPPITEQEWRRLISLPIFPDLTDDEQGRVITAVREGLEIEN